MDVHVVKSAFAYITLLVFAKHIYIYYLSRLMETYKVEDMGYRMGLNGVDNAKLLFDNVRVPRENLLNKYSEVDEDGKFTTSISGNRQRFLTVADQVCRIVIM